MRLAVISDIHSNFDAFKAVMDDISRQSVDEIISLGDNIGYGPEPEEVMNSLKHHGIDSIRGNHELAFLDENYLKTFNPSAKKALIINRDRISAKSGKYIAGLKPWLVRHGCRFVHGVPPETTARYVFKVPEPQLIKIMEGLEERLTFVGHTHQLGVYELLNGVLEKKELVNLTLPLEKTGRYIINAGSVGQPRDGYIEAKYVLWDSVTNVIQSRLVPYEYGRTVGKMKKAGIPEQYAERLEKGIV